jgi:hypothetical protein
MVPGVDPLKLFGCNPDQGRRALTSLNNPKLAKTSQNKTKRDKMTQKWAKTSQKTSQNEPKLYRTSQKQAKISQN